MTKGYRCINYPWAYCNKPETMVKGKDTILESVSHIDPRRVEVDVVTCPNDYKTCEHIKYWVETELELANRSKIL